MKTFAVRSRKSIVPCSSPTALHKVVNLVLYEILLVELIALSTQINYVITVANALL